MSFLQRAKACPVHDDCTVIDCVTDADVTDGDGAVTHPADSVVWWSHMHSDIHADHRINPDHPAEDHHGDPIPITKTDWCDECLAHPTCGPKEGR